MRCDAKAPDEQQAKESAKAEATGASKKSLSRLDGDGSDFSDRSSKRRTHLTKLYKCLEPDCVKRFAQQQNLDRHIEREHRAVPTKYCHCTVDGCKYASTGEWRKSFLRADQAKEHIKEYGHYGPHSANVRPRRAENTLPPGHSITIYLEEWTALDEDRSSQHQRTIQSYEYDSSKTKLWHEDNTGDQFCREEFDGCLDGLSCQETDCYYHSCPPEGLERVFFKTEKGLQEHSRRAHEPPGDTASDLAPRQTIHYQIYESKQPDSTTGLENFNQTPWGSGIEYPNELDSYDQIFRAPDWTNEAFTHEPLDPAVSLDWGELFAAEPRVATAPQPAARELSSSFDCLPRSSNGKDQNLHLDVNIQDQTTVSTWNPIVSTFDFEMAYPLDSFISSPVVDNSLFSHVDNYLPQPTTSYSATNVTTSIPQNISQQRFKCYSCEQSFARATDRERHKRDVHDDPKYSCPFPGCERTGKRGFSRRDKLNRHQQRHKILDF